MKTISRDISEKNFRPVYLICGEEAYLRHSLKVRMRDAVTGGNSMNYLYLEGAGIDPVQIIDTAETLPFFADKRLIVVENSGFFRKESGQLAEYLPGMPETTCLVFIEENPDKRNRLYRQVQKLGYIAECSRQSREALARWALKGLSQAGKKISARTMEYFLSKTGEDMDNIHQELEKLISYSGDREVITSEDVDAVTTEQISGRIFEMIDAIAARNQKKAMDLYYDLLVLREPPMKIIALIARQFYALLQVKELKDSGANRQEILAGGKWRPFVTERYLRQSGSFSSGELKKFAGMCVETDEAVKQGNLRDGLAAEMLIIAFTGNRR